MIQIQSRSNYGTKIKEEPQMRQGPRSTPTGLHYWSTRTEQHKGQDLYRAPPELGCINCTVSSAPKTGFGSICEPRGLSNLTPSRSRLFKLIGRVKGMMWSCSKRLAYMVANIRKREREEKAKARSNNYDQEVILEQPTSSITPTPCSLPGLRREETVTVTHVVDVF